MDKIVKIFKSLSDKNRLRVIKMLQKRPLCVCEITAILGLATSTVSSHLSVLKETGIIKDVKNKKWVDYYLIKDSKNIYLSALLPLMLYWLESDEIIKSDMNKLKTVNRIELCNL